RKRLLGGGQYRLAAGKLLPTLDGDIDITGINIDRICRTSCGLRRDKGRSGPGKRVIDGTAAIGVIEDRPAHTLHRFLGAVTGPFILQRTRPTLAEAIGDKPQRALFPVPLPVAGLTLTHGIPAGFMLNVIAGATDDEMRFGPNDLRA